MGADFLCLFLCNFFCNSLGVLYSITLVTGLGGGQRGACNEPPSRGLRTGVHGA